MDNSENDADADDGNDNNKHSNDEDNYQSVADDMQPQKLSGNPYLPKHRLENNKKEENSFVMVLINIDQNMGT